jgi:hypothetical protein
MVQRAHRQAGAFCQLSDFQQHPVLSFFMRAAMLEPDAA